MTNGKTLEINEIVVETSPMVLDKMYDFYTENYGYFLHKEQMKDIGVKPKTLNGFTKVKRVPKGKTFKPINRKRTFKPRVPKPLPPKVEYLKREFEFLESKALNECANDDKYYNKVENWIYSHEKLTTWEREKIFSYRVPENILDQIIEKTGNKIRLFEA